MLQQTTEKMPLFVLRCFSPIQRRSLALRKCNKVRLYALHILLGAFLLTQIGYSQTITITNITDYDETTTPKGNCVISGDTDVSKNGSLMDAISFGSSSWGVDKINGESFVRMPSTGINGRGEDRLKNPGLHVHISVGGDTQIAGKYSSNSAPYNNLSSPYKGMLNGGTYRKSGFKTYLNFEKLNIGEEYEFQIWISDPNYVGNYRGSLVRLEKHNGGSFRYKDNGKYVTNKNIKISKNNSSKKGGVGSFVTGKFIADGDKSSIVVHGFGHINGVQIRRLVQISKGSKSSLNFNSTSIGNGASPADWKIYEDGYENHHGSESYRGFNANEQGSIKPFISKDIKREGSGALCVQLKAPTNPASTSQRTEVNLNIDDANFFHIAPGEERYFAYSFRLEPGFPDPQGWFNMHQVKHRRSPYQTYGNIPFIQFGFYSGDGYLEYSANPGGKGKLIKPKRGVWYDVVIGWRFSPESPNGFISVWLKEATSNSYKKYERKNIKVGYNDRPYSSYSYNFGMYKKAEGRSYKMYFDAAKMGKTFESVRIKEEKPKPVIADIPNGEYFIQDPSGNVKINSPSGRTINTANTTGSSARWQITKSGSYYTIKNLRNNEFLEVPYGACDINGTSSNLKVNLGTYSNAGSNHQRWKITQLGNDYFFTPLHCNKVIDRYNGNPMHLWAYQDGNKNQNWRIVSTSKPVVANIPNGEYFIQDPSGNVKINSPSGRTVNTANTTGSSARWQITKSGSYYTIKNLRNNEFLEVPYGACDINGTSSNLKVNLGTYSNAGSNHQRWKITQLGADYFFTPLHCNKVIDRYNGNPMHLWVYLDGNKNQNWRIVSVRGAKVSSDGVEESQGQANSAIAIYPNPVQGEYFNIDLGKAEASRISVLDVQGKVVYQVQTNEQHVTLSKTRMASSGLYFVRIEQKGATVMKKVLVQ